MRCPATMILLSPGIKESQKFRLQGVDDFTESCIEHMRRAKRCSQGRRISSQPAWGRYVARQLWMNHDIISIRCSNSNKRLQSDMYRK